MKHKEMMSILHYCSVNKSSLDLERLRARLYIDYTGQPCDQEMMEKWIRVSETMEEHNIKDAVVAFLVQIKTELNMPGLEKTISCVKSLSDEKITELQAVKVNYWNRSDIKIEQDYRDMLQILDYCYFHTYNDDLGDLLGSLAIDIWADRLPADLADYEIWLDSIEPIKNRDIVTKIVAFLEAFRARYEFGDEFQPTIAFVKSLTEEQIKEITQSNSNM